MPDLLLRTLAAVPVANRILDVGGGEHTIALARLGFEVHVCAYDRGQGERLRVELGSVPEARWYMLETAAPFECPYPDAFFDWIVAFNVLSFDVEPGLWGPVLEELRRVLIPGGWLYIAVSDSPVPAPGPGETSIFSVMPALEEVMAAAGWAVAQEPSVTAEGAAGLVEAVYRRVEIDTPV